MVPRRPIPSIAVLQGQELPFSINLATDLICPPLLLLGSPSI